MDFLHYIFAFDAEHPLLFTQFYFWGFFALVYALFALIMDRVPDSLGNKKLHLRNVYLMFVSWFFYYKTSGLFLLILLFVTLSDWLIAQGIKSQITNHKSQMCATAHFYLTCVGATKENHPVATSAEEWLIYLRRWAKRLK